GQRCREGADRRGAERIRTSTPHSPAVDGQLVDVEPGDAECPGDSRRAGQGHVVFGVLAAADHHDPAGHATLLVTRDPMPVTTLCGMVPAQRAQSWMVGVAPPSGPNTVA